VSEERALYNPTNDNDLLGFDSDDFLLPRVKINKDNGLFVCDAMGIERESLHVVILKIAKSRFMWPKKFDRNAVPECYSRDSQTPVDPPPGAGMKLRKDGQEIITCTGCQFAKWQGGEKPRCAVSYDYLLYDLETDSVMVLNLSRARTITAKALNSFFKMHRVRFSVVLMTELESRDAGDFFQVKFQVKDRLGERLDEMKERLTESRDLLLTANVAEIRELQNGMIAEPVGEPDDTRDIDPETGEIVNHNYEEVPF